MAFARSSFDIFIHWRFSLRCYPEEITVRIIVGSIGLLLGAVVYPFMNRETVKRRLRKLCEENAGPDKTFNCEVELNQLGIHAKTTAYRLFTPGRM